MSVHPLAAPGTPTWAERNQRWLASRLAHWRERIEALDDASAVPPSEPPAETSGFTPAAVQLAETFGLSGFETDVLVLAAGIEIDAALRKAVARVQGVGDGRAVRLAWALALQVLPLSHWDAISPLAPLRAWSLVEFDTANGFTQATLRIDERILHAITGVEAFDGRLAGIACASDVVEDPASANLVAPMTRALVERPDALVVLPDARLDAGRFRTARRLAHALLQGAGRRALWVEEDALGLDARDLHDIARRIAREAAIARAGVILALGDEDSAHASAALRVVDMLDCPVIVLGAPNALALAGVRRPVLRFPVPRLQASLPPGMPSHVHAAARAALQQFRVDGPLLDQALQSIAHVQREAAVDQALWQALREAARGGLDALAQRIDGDTTFDDLVAPAYVIAQLRELAAQLRHRLRVYEDWGFGRGQSRGLGIAALFAGESGTGKTMAAEAIAHAARLDLYRIDLSSVVSKYIGETEKNLARVFDAAEASGAILLFDEADALFGKRSEVKDSHDRYANIEIAYLLQRIESYRGLAILTTNMKNALDRAFLRRLRFIVQFPFPDVQAREQLWRRQFPAAAPLGHVDFEALSRLQLTGGSIRSVALQAAFKAADAGRPIEHDVLVAAAQVELAKLARTNGTPRGSLQ